MPKIFEKTEQEYKTALERVLTEIKYSPDATIYSSRELGEMVMLLLEIGIKNDFGLPLLKRVKDISEAMSYLRGEENFDQEFQIRVKKISEKIFNYIDQKIDEIPTVAELNEIWNMQTYIQIPTAIKLYESWALQAYIPEREKEIERLTKTWEMPAYMKPEICYDKEKVR